MRNKTIFWLMMAITVVGTIYWFKQRKKTTVVQPSVPDQNSDTSKPKQPQNQPMPIKEVKELQIFLNSQLPPDYPKLVVDGIFGPKTKAALEYVRNQKMLTGDKNTVQILNDIYQLSPVGDIVAGFKFFEERLKQKWQAFKNLFK